MLWIGNLWHVAPQGKPVAGQAGLSTCRVRRPGRPQLPLAIVHCSRPMGAAGSGGQHVPQPSGSCDPPNPRTQQAKKNQPGPPGGPPCWATCQRLPIPELDSLLLDNNFYYIFMSCLELNATVLSNIMCPLWQPGLKSKARIFMFSSALQCSKLESLQQLQQKNGSFF